MSEGKEELPSDAVGTAAAAAAAVAEAPVDTTLLSTPTGVGTLLSTPTGVGTLLSTPTGLGTLLSAPTGVGTLLSAPFESPTNVSNRSTRYSIAAHTAMSSSKTANDPSELYIYFTG